MMETHLLVPSADLGVYVTLASGKPIVTKVLLSLLSFIKKESRATNFICVILYNRWWKFWSHDTDRAT